MRTRSSDFALVIGILGLAAAIGDGQVQSARARERHDPLLWQLQIFDEGGHLLRDREFVGAENELFSLGDPGLSPQLSLSLLPLGLPGGDLDVQLRFSVDGSNSVPFPGVKITPGKLLRLNVPGQPYTLALRAVRIGSKRPLLS